MHSHILVTGGAGFIGSNFVRMLLRERPDTLVTTLDALTYSGNLNSLADVLAHPRHRFVHGDIRDANLVRDLVSQCDAVVHLAAESHVDRSIVDARPFVSTNVEGTACLLDAAVAAWDGDHSRRFLTVGTDEVYGSLPLDDEQSRFSEGSPLQPSSPYSATKTASDLLTLAYHTTHGLPTLVTRCSNNFGPYQYPEKVIPLFVTNLLEGKKVPLYGDGLNVRDWIHVDDHCEALLTVLERGEPGQVYNVGADNERSNIQLTWALLEIMGRGGEMIEHVRDRPGHDRRYAVDASRLRDELGWHPTRSGWPGALESTVRWYTDNPQWWRPLKHRQPFDGSIHHLRASA